MVPPDSDRISPVPSYSGSHYRPAAFAYRPFTVCGAAFQAASTQRWIGSCGPSTPRQVAPPGFGLHPVRSPLLGISLLFSSPQGTEMFQFPRFASTPKGRYPDHSGWVSPFGHPRINASLQLPAAYRSLARPSSPLYA